MPKGIPNPKPFTLEDSPEPLYQIKERADAAAQKLLESTSKVREAVQAFQQLESAIGQFHAVLHGGVKQKRKYTKRRGRPRKDQQ